MTLLNRQPSPARLSVLALAVALSLAACSKDNQTADQHIQRAKEFAAQGKSMESQIELRNALQKEPGNSQAHLLQAEMYMKVGNPYIAETVLKKALAAGVPAEAVKVDLGRALLMQGKPADALKAVQGSPGDSKQNQIRVLDMQSRILLALGKGDESCGKANEAYKLMPESTLALQGMARCALGDKKLSAAENYLRGALEKDKNDPSTWGQLGGLAHAQGKDKEAEEAYRHALTLDPLLGSVRIQLANLLLDDKKLDEARTVLQQGNKVGPNPMFSELLAQIDFRQGKFTQARDGLVKLLKDYPDFMPAILLNGLTASALGNNEQAAKDLSRYLAQFPNNALARRTLAAAQLHLGQGDLVPQTLAPLTSGTKPDAAALGLLGEAYLDAGDYAKATAALQKSTALDSKGPMPRILLGMSYLAAGNEDKATAELTAAARMEPRSTRAESLLIAFHMDRKQYDKALAVIAELDKKRPKDPSVLNQRGLALVGKKDYANARAAFEAAAALKPGYYPAASGLARLDVLEKKDYASARKRFEAILSADKTSLQAMMALANLAELEGKNKDYVEWMRKAIAAHKDAVEPRLALGQHFLNHKDARSALTLAQESTAALPKSPVALGMLARAQMAAGEKDNAIATFQKLVNLAPRDAGSQYQLGLLLAEAKKAGPAREALSRANSLDPGNPSIAEALAMLELSQGKSAEALQVAKNLRQRNVAAGYTLEGNLLVRQSKIQESVQAFTKAFEADRNGKTLLRLHTARLRLGERPGAEKLLTDWLAKNPKDSAVRMQYAAALASRGADRESAAEYEILLGQMPDNPFVMNDLAWVYAKLGDARALGMAEKALKGQPGNPQLMDTYGWVLLQAGQTAKAVQQLEAAAKASPIPAVRAHYIQALVRTGDKTKARTELDALLKAYPKFSQSPEAKELRGQLP